MTTVSLEHLTTQDWQLLRSASFVGEIRLTSAYMTLLLEKTVSPREAHAILALLASRPGYVGV